MVICPACLSVWGILGTLVYFVYSKLFKKSCCSQPKVQREDWKKDTVYLYQFPRPDKLANLSPFCIKLEMFMRLNNIPYEVCVISTSRSKYGLVPFIELNGVQYADSQLIMEKLKNHYDIKLLSDPRNESFARALDRMADNHSFYVFMKMKVLDQDFASTLFKTMIAPAFLLPFIKFVFGGLFVRRVRNRIFASLGPYSDQEFHLLLKKDLDAYRDALGNRKFLMGDEPTAVDCTVFGQLVTLCHLEMANEVQRLVRAEYPTLVAYQERIIEKVFPAEFK